MDERTTNNISIHGLFRKVTLSTSKKLQHSRGNCNIKNAPLLPGLCKQPSSSKRFGRRNRGSAPHSNLPNVLSPKEKVPDFRTRKESQHVTMKEEKNSSIDRTSSHDCSWWCNHLFVNKVKNVRPYWGSDGWIQQNQK